MKELDLDKPLVWRTKDHVFDDTVELMGRNVGGVGYTFRITTPGNTEYFISTNPYGVPYEQNRCKDHFVANVIEDRFYFLMKVDKGGVVWLCSPILQTMDEIYKRYLTNKHDKHEYFIMDIRHAVFKSSDELHEQFS